jgi:hypothetical protein
MADKAIHQIKKVILIAVVVQTVQPINFIVSYKFVMIYYAVIACTRRY